MSLLYNVLDKLRDIASKDSKTDVSEAIKSTQTTESELKRRVKVAESNYPPSIEDVAREIVVNGMSIQGAMDYAGPEVAQFLQRMYDEVAHDYRLHPDDDFEQIEDRMVDQLAADFGINEADDSAEEDVFQQHADSQGIDREDQLPSTPRQINVEARQAKYARYAKLSEGFDRKVSRMVNEQVTANVSPDNNISITATTATGSTAEEADAISAILRNAGIVNKDPVSSMDPMGAGAMSSGYDPIGMDTSMDPLPSDGEMTGADLEVAPFAGDMNSPTDDVAPEAGLNTPDYADGVDDFGVDYSIDANDGLEGDVAVDVVGNTDGLGDGTDIVDPMDDEEELMPESNMLEWANSKNGSDEQDDDKDRGQYQDDIYMLQTLAGGLNKPKQHTNVNNPGDNPMNADNPADGGSRDMAKRMTESKREKELNESAAQLEAELLQAFKQFK